MEDYKSKTRESYNKHATEFSDKFKGLFDLEQRSEFGKFINLIPGKRILDIGCGGGDHGVYFQSQGFDVMGIDLSEEMIRISNSKGLNARVMDMEQMDFPDSSFDGVWAVTSLLHLPKVRLPAVVEKVHSLLDNQGIFFVCLKEGDSEGLKVDYNDTTTRRYFSFWQQNDLERVFSPYFNLVDSEKKRPNDTVYLHNFFRKI